MFWRILPPLPVVAAAVKTMTDLYNNALCRDHPCTVQFLVRKYHHLVDAKKWWVFSMFWVVNYWFLCQFSHRFCFQNNPAGSKANAQCLLTIMTFRLTMDLKYFPWVSSKVLCFCTGFTSLFFKFGTSQFDFIFLCKTCNGEFEIVSATFCGVDPRVSQADYRTIETSNGRNLVRFYTTFAFNYVKLYLPFTFVFLCNFVA